MAFSDQEKVDIRRFCGFPVHGQGNATTMFAYVYYQKYLILEGRLLYMTTQEENVIRTVFLANLYQLEAAVLTASDNLDTDVAAVWKHNKYEVRDRTRLFNWERRRLLAMIFQVDDMPMNAGATANLSMIV